MNIDADYMQFLAEVANKMDSAFRARIAAMLVYKREIIAIGKNRQKSHPLAAKYSRHPDAIWIHAELDTIIQAARYDAERLKKTTLYVCRAKFVTPDRRKMIWGNAKPCSGCAAAIAAYEIPRVVYSTGINEEFEVVE